MSKLQQNRSASVAVDPPNPQLNVLRDFLESVAETPKGLSKTHSVKEILDRVEQTLKKAGIANIIKGINTYHTTP